MTIASASSDGVATEGTVGGMDPEQLDANSAPAVPPPAAPSGDLAALTALLATETRTAADKAAAEFASTHGFESPEAMADYVTSRKEADTAAMTEVERRETAAAEATTRAETATAAAAGIVRTATAERALIRAHVSPEAATVAVRLLDLPTGELTDEAVDEAVETLKAKEAFTFLFGADPAGFQSGVTPPAPATSAAAPTTALAQGAADFKRLHPVA